LYSFPDKPCLDDNKYIKKEHKINAA